MSIEPDRIHDDGPLPGEQELSYYAPWGCLDVRPRQDVEPLTAMLGTMPYRMETADQAGFRAACERYAADGHRCAQVAWLNRDTYLRVYGGAR